MNLMIGLLQSWPVVEASWAGYARQPIEFSEASWGMVKNTNEITFAKYDEPGLVIVDHLMIFRDGAEVARIPLSSPIGISRNVTVMMFVGAVVALAEHLTDRAIAYAAGAPLLPTNCKKCNHHNPYVGVEHLNAAGEYICRGCR